MSIGKYDAAFLKTITDLVEAEDPIGFAVLRVPASKADRRNMLKKLTEVIGDDENAARLIQVVA